MSPSINNTLAPISARALPRLLTTVVLHCMGCELVTTSTWGRSPLRAERMDANVLRNDSDRHEDACSRTALSTRSFPLGELKNPNADRLRAPSSGIAPSAGNTRYVPPSPGACRATGFGSRITPHPISHTNPPTVPTAHY